jgi:hypothetical protein
VFGKGKESGACVQTIFGDFSKQVLFLRRIVLIVEACEEVG